MLQNAKIIVSIVCNSKKTLSTVLHNAAFTNTHIYSHTLLNDFPVKKCFLLARYIGHSNPRKIGLTGFCFFYTCISRLFSVIIFQYTCVIRNWISATHSSPSNWSQSVYMQYAYNISLSLSLKCHAQNKIETLKNGTDMKWHSRIIKNHFAFEVCVIQC